ncbi:MAG: hypothetical protein IKO36_10700 [Bacteroidaceae bacterium]|nr:hypothetical protein [Bacteroidaceae bacterium]
MNRMLSVVLLLLHVVGFIGYFFIKLFINVIRNHIEANPKIPVIMTNVFLFGSSDGSSIKKYIHMAVHAKINRSDTDINIFKRLFMIL